MWGRTTNLLLYTRRRYIINIIHILCNDTVLLNTCSNCCQSCIISEPPVPRNVTVTRINDTAMVVSWHKFTLVELKGFAMYVIIYTVVGESRKRQSNQMVTAMWFENNKTIGGLPPRLAVDVQVRTMSNGGTSSKLCEGVVVRCGLGGTCGHSKALYSPISTSTNTSQFVALPH